MDTVELSRDRLDAGRAYYVVMAHLGLDIDMLFWAFDTTMQEAVLVLVTSQFDRVGPLALSKLLFEAYEKGGTPAEISPFIIRMHSPNHAIAIGLRNSSIVTDLTFKAADDRPTPPADSLMRVENRIGDLIFRPHWIYKYQDAKKFSSFELQRHWRQLQRNVQKLAA